MLNAVSISGSNSGFGKKLSFALNSTYEMTFNDETEYEISFHLRLEESPPRIYGNSTQIGRLGFSYQVPLQQIITWVMN